MKTEKMLSKIAEMATQNPPDTFSENGDNIWKAFNLGIRYAKFLPKADIHKPFAWYCPKCKKFDIASAEEQLASPEHVSHRGVDIGSCKGEMISLYT